MKLLRTPDDILEFAAQHAPSKACQTAIRFGKVRIGPAPALQDTPGWLIIIDSDRGRRWFGTITVDEKARKYRMVWQ